MNRHFRRRPAVVRSKQCDVEIDLQREKIAKCVEYRFSQRHDAE